MYKAYEIHFLLVFESSIKYNIVGNILKLQRNNATSYPTEKMDF